jgi:hypothetical protein
MRATRRLDHLREAQKNTVGLNTGARGIGTSVRVDDKPTLASQGIPALAPAQPVRDRRRGTWRTGK